MDLLQEYKELYYKEIEFKDSMSGKIGTSITLITILCTGHMFMWNIMTQLEVIFHIIPIIFLLLETSSVFYTALSMYNFYKAYFKYNYDIVSPESVAEIITRNNSLLGKYTKEEIDNANLSMLQNTYITYAIKNRAENLRKNMNQIRLSSSITKAIMLLIITYTMWIFIINQLTF